VRKENKIKQRIRGLLVVELDRRVQEATRRIPNRCSYNVSHPLDVRKTVNGEHNPQYNHILSGGQTLGLCLYGAKDPSSWQGTICDEPIDAQRCPYFTPTVNKEGILKQFRDDLQDAEWVRKNLPGVSELLWVLEMTELPKLPIWTRVWYWFLRIRVEPVVSVNRLHELCEDPDFQDIL